MAAMYISACIPEGTKHHGVQRERGHMVMSKMLMWSSKSRMYCARSKYSAIASIAVREQGLEGLALPLPSAHTTLYVGKMLYVGNLPMSVDSQKLLQFFQDVGTVECSKIIYDKETHKSRGFAFVTMTTVQDSHKAINQLDGTDLEHRVVKVNFPNSVDLQKGGGIEVKDTVFGNSMSQPGTKLYVGNLPRSVQSGRLGEFFSTACGAVHLVEIIYNRETHNSRGFAFVTMRTIEDSHKAIKMLDGCELDGRILKVKFPSAVDLKRGLEGMEKFEPDINFLLEHQELV